MTSPPTLGAWMRVAVPLVALIAFLASTLLRSEADGPTDSKGEGWSIARSDRGPPVPELDGKGIILRHGDSFRLTDPEDSEHRITRIRLVLERLGESGFADLRFRTLPDVAHELKIARANSFGVLLLHVPRDAPRTRLAATDGSDPIPRMLTPFEFVVEFEAGRIIAAVNGEEVLSCADDRERDGAVELFARAEPLRVHSVVVEGTRRDEPYRLQVDFASVEESAVLAPLLRAAAIAVLVFALLATWLNALVGGRRTWRDCIARAAFPGMSPLAITTVASCFLRSPISPTSAAIASLLGVILARCALGRDPIPVANAAPSRTSRSFLAAAVIVLFGAIGFRGSERELAHFDIVRAHHRAAAREPNPVAFRHDQNVTLDAGNSIIASGAFRDFDLRANLRMVPDSVLEVRLRGQRSDGVVFVLSSSDRTATRFVRATPMEFEAISNRAAPAPDSRAIDLEIEVRGESYLARIDGHEVCSASERLFPSGEIVLAAARGRVVLSRLDVDPLASAATDDGATRDAIIGALRSIVPMVALALLATWLLRRDLLGLSFSVGIAALPFAISLGELGRVAAQGAAAIAPPVFFFVALAFDHLQRAKESSPFRLNVSLVGALVVATLWYAEARRREWPPLEEELNALTCLDVDDGAPLAPELLHFEHPLFRRWNFYLQDHRFRKRTFSAARVPGRARVLALGTSSTYGYGANEDWPTLLEQELRSAAFGSRSVEVINAGTPGSTSWRLLYFLEHALLRFDPDVLVISFYYNDSVALTQFDERAELSRIASEGTNPLRNLLVSRMLDAGRSRFLRLDLDFRARDFDPVATWDVPNLSPPPERFEAVIRDYAELCRARGIGLVLLQEPISGDRKRIWKDEFRAAFTRIGAEYGAPVIDPSAAQVAAGAEKLFMDEVHPYVEGHRITAKLLAPAVAGVLDSLGGK